MTMDLHTHSMYSDGADTLETNLAAAIRNGVTVFGASDHVRRSTTWVAEYSDHVARIAASAPIEVRCGVEAKILDVSGRLDVPDRLGGVEYIAIADHRMPLETRSAHPQDVARAIDLGVTTRRQVLEMLVTATAKAARSAPRRPLIAHLFSILPKMGLQEISVPEDLVRWLGRELCTAGAMVEINEKWRCPGERTLEILRQERVAIVYGSDAHTAGQVGVFDWVRRTQPSRAPA